MLVKIFVALFVCNTIAAMDDTYPQELLAYIVHNGAIKDFDTYEPLFRKTISAHSLIQVIDFHCIPRKEALEKVILMQEHPTLTNFVVQMYALSMGKKSIAQHIAPIAHCSHKHNEEDIKNFTSIALDITHTLHISHINRVGFALKHLIKHVSMHEIPQRYLAQEHEKLTYIKNKIETMLSEEFDPPHEIIDTTDISPRLEMKRKQKIEPS